MGEAEQFRARAAQCRKLAEDARDDQSRLELNNMANELDAEAALIDVEEDGSVVRPDDT